MRSRVLVLAAVVASLTEGARAEPPSSAAVVVSSGAVVEVRTHKRHPWRPLGTGRIGAGALVRCPTGCALQLASGPRLRLGAAAEVALVGPMFVRLGGADDAAERCEHVLVEQGAVDVERSGDARAPLLLENARTGGLVAVGVGRTRFVAREDRTLVGVLDGSARVRGRDRLWSTLGPKTATTLRAGSSPTAPRPLVVAPGWLVTGQDAPAGPVALVDGAAPAPVGATWTAVPGAAAYRLDVARDRELTDAVADVRVGAGATRAATEPLPPGRYFAAVVALDADGLESERSAVLPLRVVSAELPGGARLEGRTVVVPDGRRVRLVDPGGLEVAVDRGGFVRAVPEIGAGRALRIRLEGERASETPFAVEQRALRAEVELTPRLPRWPADPIDVAVDIADPSGRTPLADLEPRITVLVGITEVAARWEEDARGAGEGHRVFRARLAPRKTAGPTVVRVLVADGDGAPIGRGFVEVDAR